MKILRMSKKSNMIGEAAENTLVYAVFSGLGFTVFRV
jgi:hypothetical protein